MIIYYEGNDIHTLHLNSSKSLELSTYELDEINSKNKSMLELEREILDLKESNDMILRDIEEQGEYIRECESLVLKLEESIEDIKNKKVKDNILNTIKELKSNIDSLDFICRHI